MPTLLQQLALAQSQGTLAPRPGRVMVYSPGRPMPGAAPAPVASNVPQQRPLGTRPATTQNTRGDAVSRSYQFYMAKAQQQQAQQQAEQQAYDEMPWWKQGLGAVLNNPITKTITTPLGALGTPRRLIEWGLGEAAKATHLNELPTWAKVAMLTNPLTMAPGIVSMLDPKRIEADKRSFTEKVLDPNSDFGFGQLITPDAPTAVGMGAGLLGDVGLDPLTYVTAGGGKVLEGGGLVGKETALHGGRAERLAELSRLAVKDPELIQRLEPDILRAGRRGLNTASPELRDALGLTAPRIKFMGAAIPGTERIAQPISEGTGLIRQGLQKVPGITKISRGPKGLEAAVGTITRGTGEIPLDEALAQVKLTNLARIKGGEILTRGNRSLSNLVRRGFKGQSKEQIAKLMQEAEQKGTRNVINEFFGDMANIYQEVSGHNITPYLLDPDTYVPHMMAPGFRRMLKEQLDAGNPIADEFMKKAGFLRDDLLEGSGYIEKSRKLTPDMDAASRTLKPTDFTIGGKTITLQKGTLDELNAQLKKVFPGFTGKFYETDPARIGEAYIASLAKGGGARGALGQVADTVNPLVERIGGTEGRGPQLGQALTEVEKAQAEKYKSVNELIQQGYTPGDTLTPPAPSPEVPTDVAGLNVSDFFGQEVAREATKQQESFLRNEGVNFVKEAGRESAKVKGTAAKDLYNIRRNFIEGFEANVKEANKMMKPLDAHIAKLTKRLDELGTHRAETHDELTAFMVGIRKDIDDLEEQLMNKGKYWRGRMTTARKEAQAELEKRWRQLRALEAHAKNKMLKEPNELNQRLLARVDAANAPVRKAQAELDDLTARTISVRDVRPGNEGRIITRPSNERLASAEETLQKVGREVVDPTQAKKDEFRELLSLEKRNKKQNARLAKLQGDLQREQGRGLSLAKNEFDADTQRIIDINEQLLNVTDDAERAALNKEKRALQRRFQQGGKHNAEKIARQTMDEYEGWKQGIAKATEKQRKALSNAKAYRDLVVDDATTQADIANRTKVLEGKHAQAQRRADVMEQRVNAPIDWERDVQMVAPTREAQQASMGPIQQQFETAQALRDDVLEQTRNSLRETDAAIADNQEKMLRDTQAKQPLLDQRQKAQDLAKQLRDNTKSLRGESRGGVKGIKFKEQELIPVLDEVAAVAAQNPNLTDTSLTAVESVLQTHRRDLERVLQNDITSRQVQGLVDASFKEGKDGLAPIMTTVLNEQWDLMHEGLPQLGDVIVDHDLHTRFMNLYEMSKEPKWLGRTFNALTNLFKTYATLTPGFHVRNALSGIFMNTADGVALRAQYEGVKYWSQFMKHGEEVVKTWPADVREAFRAAAGSGAGGQFTEAGVAASSENRLYNLLSNNRITRSGILGKRGGERVEGALRMGMALDTIKKGGSVEDALGRITRVHFDYSQVSRLDEQMKRVIPFWTFMSRNLPLQITEMWTKPKVYAIYQSMQRNLFTTPGAYTPRYWLESGMSNTGVEVPTMPGQEGGPLYFAPDLGFTRSQQDLTNIAKLGQGDISGVASAFNPLLTAPAEFFTKRDFYTGQQFGPNDNVYADPLTTALGRVFHQTNEAGQTQIPFQNMLRAINPLMDRSIRFAPSLVGGTQRDESRQLESYARFLGVPARVLTPTAQNSEYWRRYYKLADEAARQQKMLELQARQAG